MLDDLIPFSYEIGDFKEEYISIFDNSEVSKYFPGAMLTDQFCAIYNLNTLKYHLFYSTIKSKVNSLTASSFLNGQQHVKHVDFEYFEDQHFKKFSSPRNTF